MNTGIYSITSPSGGQYIGSAVNFDSRWGLHRHLLNKGKHYNLGLQRACKKYGIENLVFTRILVCAREHLIMFEQRAIDVLKPRYNACPVAGSQLGRRHSKEANEKNAAAHRGKKLSLEHKEKLARFRFGNKNRLGHITPLETRQKISKALKGRRHANSLESRLTASDRRDIAARYLNGINLLKFARELRTDHRILHRIIVAEGVEIRPRGRTLKSMKK